MFFDICDRDYYVDYLYDGGIVTIAYETNPRHEIGDIVYIWIEEVE
jgi:hypothetical protein